jgi:hypothetical protein
MTSLMVAAAADRAETTTEAARQGEFIEHLVFVPRDRRKINSEYREALSFLLPCVL